MPGRSLRLPARRAVGWWRPVPKMGQGYSNDFGLLDEGDDPPGATALRAERGDSLFDLLPPLRYYGKIWDK